MISNSSGDVLSNLGWVDRGSVWRFRRDTGSVDRIQIGEAGFLSLYSNTAEHTVIVDYRDQARRVVEVRPADLSGDAIARVEIVGDRSLVTGDLALFGPTRHWYIHRFLDDNARSSGYRLIEIGPEGVEVRPFHWFEDGGYDGVYQSVISVIELPSGELLFGVQRSSDLVLCDPRDLSAIRRVPLANRSGNSTPFLRAGGTELWAIDYDTLVRLDVENLEVQDQWRGQDSPEGTMRFLGSVWSEGDRTPLLVARPGSGDVVEVDADRFSEVQRWHTGRQPLEAALIDGELIARDWKTGDLLTPSSAV
jgi:hypothetical protein